MNKSTQNIAKHNFLLYNCFRGDNLNKVEIGKRIRHIRKNWGDSMTKFGERIDKNSPIKSGVISNWENGKQLPNNERLKRIAELGDLSVNQLIYGDFLTNLENITHKKILHILEDNFLDYDEDLYNELRNSVSGIILSMFERGEDNFNSKLFEDLLTRSLQLELDLGNRDLDSLTEFAYNRTINAQDLVVEYYDDTKAKEFLKDKKIKEFLCTISDKYFEILNYINDYREDNDLERLDK